MVDSGRCSHVLAMGASSLLVGLGHRLFCWTQDSGHCRTICHSGKDSRYIYNISRKSTLLKCLSNTSENISITSLPQVFFFFNFLGHRPIWQSDKACGLLLGIMFLSALKNIPKKTSCNGIQLSKIVTKTRFSLLKHRIMRPTNHYSSEEIISCLLWDTHNNVMPREDGTGCWWTQTKVKDAL